MPPVRSARNRKPPPEGFDDIEDTLLEFANKMKDAENDNNEGKKKHEALWPIFQITHQRKLPRNPYQGSCLFKPSQLTLLSF
jgi:bud site selection protein 31